MEITIKQATNADVKKLSAIAQLTFPLAGPADSSPLEISKYTQNNLNDSVFQKLVENDKIFVGCAHTDAELAGFIVLNYCSHQPNNEIVGSSAELQRLYVLEKYHGSNIAKLLVSEVFKKCLDKQIDSIWLNVYSENNRAKKFYAKFGFQETGTTLFKMGAETHLDNVMTAKVT